MANYEAHRSTGLSWWLLASLGLYAFKDSFGLSDGAVLLAAGVGLPATLMGAGFPDVDLASSIPHRRFRLTLFLISSVFGLWLALQARAQEVLRAALRAAVWPETALPLAALLLALTLGALAVALLAFFLPPHRGLTHRWPAGLSVAALLAALTGMSLSGMNAAQEVVTVASLATFGFFVLGFASHLFKDGLLFKRPARKRS